MLELIRQYRSLFSVIFVVSAVGMIVSMFGGNFRSGAVGGGGLSSGVAARVEGEEITSAELLQSLSYELQEAQRNMEAQSKDSSPETRKFMEQMIKAQVTPDRVLQRLIQRRFLVATADTLGIEAAPENIRDLIQDNPVFQKDGRFDPILYKQRVAEPATYERELAMQSKFTTLNEAFEAGAAVISPAEEHQNELLKSKRVFESLRVKAREFPEPKSVDADEAKKWAADPANEPKLHAYYDRNSKKFNSDLQVHAKHILIDEKAGGEAKIKDVLAEIKDKKISWDEAAKKYSTDKSNAAKGGDLGFFGHGMMDPAFEKGAFALKAKDEISAPVQSSFGWHLIQLIERKEPVKRDFASVKDSIVQEALLEDRRMAKAKEAIDAWTKSDKGPSESELKKLSLSWKKEPEWTALDGYLGSVGSVEGHLSEILALNHEKPLLKTPLSSGEDLVLVRWIETKATDAAPAEAPKAKGKDAKSAKPAVAAKENPAKEKAMEVFEYYLQARFKDLEKDKKIVKSEKVLKDLRQRMGNISGAPDDDG